MATRIRKNEGAIFVFVFVFVFLKICALCTSTILSTNSRWIVDNASGNRVKLTCVNWVASMEPMIAEGLEKKPVDFIAKKIVELGFNCVRFTWATYMFTRPEYGNLKVSESLDFWGLKAAKAGMGRHNPSFLNMTVVEAHHAVVEALGKNKVMVVLSNHVSRPTWCCEWKDGNGFFNDKDFDPDEWLKGLAEVARAYKGNPAVVGMNLRNELRSPRENPDDWYIYMPQGFNTIHRENPDLLIMVSGLLYSTDLYFIQTRPFPVNATNKLVYEGLSLSYGASPKQWMTQTNFFCDAITRQLRKGFLFVTSEKNPSPLFLSEFGMSILPITTLESEIRYLPCLLATVAEDDNDWGVWKLQGSYMFRQGKVDMDEVDGILDFNWDRPRNPDYLQKLQAIRPMNQDFKSKKPTLYKLFHPMSAQCVHIGKEGVFVSSCERASLWEKHEDGGLIKLASDPARCLGVAGEGASPTISTNCSTNNSKWKFVSSVALHLAAQDDQGKYLCLEKNGSDSQIVTKKCLCVDDNLVDLYSCLDNPELQWFKLVPANTY